MDLIKVKENKMENKKGIGLFPLIALVISGAIGGGVFNLSNDLAAKATPGGIVASWVFVGGGILMLVLTLNFLVRQHEELSGLSDYARAGFGNLIGFISGWGYWLSSWFGSIAFAVLMMTSADYFWPGLFAGRAGNMTLTSVIVASVISWLLTLLVSRGIESAALVNAVILIGKLVPLLVFIIAGIVVFKAGVFTAHFWQNVATNTDLTHFDFSKMTLSGLVGQTQSSLLVMIWVFVGIEGATMMGDRARRKSDAGRASILGLLSLLVIYTLLSLLPFGYMDQGSLANVPQPGLVHVLTAMVGPWGGALMAVGLILSLLGSWLSWTMLPAEAAQQLSEQKLLPRWFGVLNDKNAPAHALFLTQAFLQFFILVSFFVSNAYNVFVFLSTSVMMICYALAGAYLTKEGIKAKKLWKSLVGLLALVFQLLVLWLSGWQFLWLATILYSIGFALFIYARRQDKQKIKLAEWIGMLLLMILAIAALYFLIAGAKTGTALDLRTLLGL